LAKRLVVLGVLAALGLAPVARADGDPASDYLLGQPTFIPPDVGVPRAYADQLNATVREAKARGYTIRVGLIGSRYDMGSVSILYKKPKQYSRFLGQELAFVYKNRLLIVMPNGLAVSRAGKLLPPEQAVVERLPAPGGNGARLASAASRAVIRLAAKNGIVVPSAPLASSGRTTPSSHTTSDRLTLIVVALAAALAFGGSILYRRRAARGP